MKTSPVNVILAVLILVTLGIAGKLLPARWEQRERDARRAAEIEASDQTRAAARVAEIRAKMRNMPPGGELELLAADLRQAEAELHGRRE
jgi:hypothetical protein